MCELFGESLDRVTLWDRIGSAIATAAAKCDDGDTDRFASLCLEHVKADHAAAARHEGFAAWVVTMAARDDAYRQAFVRHCGSPGVSRERRPGGNDACAEGHVYPSKAAVMTPVPAAVDGCVEGSPLPAAEANGKRPDPDFNRWGA